MIATFFSALNINKIVILFNSSAVFSKSKSQQRIFIPFWKNRFQTGGGGGGRKTGVGFGARLYVNTDTHSRPPSPPFRFYAQKTRQNPLILKTQIFCRMISHPAPLKTKTRSKTALFWGSLFIAQNFVLTPCECTKLWIY